jgi:hypothetical protein
LLGALRFFEFSSGSHSSSDIFFFFGKQIFLGRCG